MNIKELFKNIENKRILILGDVMVDSYYSGPVDRISPEAPVPIIRLTEKDDRLGGAANVARNIQSLGAVPILCSVVGSDVKGDIFMKLLKDQDMPKDGILQLDNRPTTVKTRVMSNNQQIIRVDEESTDDLRKNEEDSVIILFKEIIFKYNIDAVIYEDYNKGLLTPRVIEETMKICTKEGILTTVDPKKDNFFAFKHCSLFKPNLKEVREGLKQDVTDINVEALSEVANDLREKLDQKYTLLTLSEHGVYYEDNGEAGMIPAHKRDIADVSGAGDTVIATVTLFLVAGADIEQAAHFANLAGGLVCESVGVVPIDKDKLLEEALRVMLGTGKKLI